MRSFFNRPFWASTGDDNAPSDFYRRSQHTYADIVAANRKLRDRMTGDSGGDYQLQDREATKRRRISHSDEYAEREDACEASLKESHHHLSVKDVEYRPHSAESDQESSSGSHYNITSLQDVPEEAVEATSKPKIIDVEPLSRRSSSSVNSTHENEAKNRSFEDDELTSDGEFSGLAQKARERMQHLSELPTYKNRNSQASGSSDTIQPAAKAPRHDICPTHASSQQDDVVQILITSDIENTKPLIVHRRMSQRLRDVRLAWCRRQGFGEEMTSSVFLTWKGRRLFDVTTCRSLGIHIKGDSDPLWSSNDNPGCEGEVIRLHMEAVTDGILASRRSQSLVDPRDDTKSESEELEDTRRHDEHIRIILKSPGLDDFRVKAKPKTQISRIIASFRSAQHVPAEKHVYLLFDGERLDPNSYLGEHDIADLDLVDVQVK
ncbi:hypothetical protein VTN00DRAFT_8570 [Thermoascus crustaceus]|uniref:uncharacterized protein n=1 Tax=Thermoascus crustaceus TaxID=5088 RepID=UPI0037427345